MFVGTKIQVNLAKKVTTFGKLSLLNFAIQTNTFQYKICNFQEYIKQIKINALGKLDKYIWQCGQIHLGRIPK